MVAILSETKDWFERVTLAPNVTLLREPNVHHFFRANLYHVVGRDADLVIDFGTGLRSLSGFLDLDAGKPVVAVATHVHIDHVGSFHEFKHRIGHVIEAPYFKSMEDCATLAGYFREHPQAVSDRPSAGWNQADYAIVPAPLTEVVREGSTIDIGGVAFTVLHLPGHSPGSIALLDTRTGVLFSGDAIYDGGLVDDLPGCDKEVYRNTMSRLKDIEVSIVYGGHGNPMSQERMHDIAKTYLDRPV